MILFRARSAIVEETKRDVNARFEMMLYERNFLRTQEIVSKNSRSLFWITLKYFDGGIKQVGITLVLTHRIREKPVKMSQMLAKLASKVSLDVAKISLNFARWQRQFRTSKKSGIVQR